MKTRPNPFPIHDIVIKQLGSDIEKGKKSLISVVENIKTTVVNKLHLMSRVLQECEEKTALLVIPFLPSPDEILSNLPKVSLPHQALDALINLLIKEIPALATHQLNLYGQLSQVYSEQKDTPGENYFSCRVHDGIIAEFRNTAESGKEALKTLLDNPNTSVISKLELMSRLLQQIGKKTAILVIRSLPQSPGEIILSLSKVTLPRQDLDSLIDFIIQQKILSLRDKNPLYHQLARTYFLRDDLLNEIHYLRQALDLPNSDWSQKHNLHLCLATRYAESGADLQEDKTPPQEKILSHLKAAYEMERTGRVNLKFIEENGVIPAFIKAFKTSINNDFTRPALDQLTNILQLVPDDPRVIKVVTDYVDEGIKRSKDIIDTTLLVVLIDLAKMLPRLQNKVDDILNLILNAPYPLGYKAYCFCALKYYDKAIELAHAALNEDRADRDALLALGTSFFELNQLERSLSSFLSLLEQDNILPAQRQFACAQLSEAYLHLGNCMLSIQYAETAISLNPQDISTYINRITAHFELGEIKRAKKLLIEAKQRFPSSEKINLCQTQLFPQNVSLALEEKDDSRTILRQIYYHIQNQQYEAAEKKANFLILRRDKYQVAAYLALATSHESQQNYSKSLEHLLLAAKNNADPLAIASRTMRIYRHLKQYPQAEEQAWLVLNKQENTSQRGRNERLYAIIVLLEATQNSEDYQESVKKLEQALNLKDLLALEKQRLYYNLATLHYSNSAFDAAIDCCNQAIKISPQTIYKSTYLLLGYSLYESKNRQEAIGPLRTYLDIDPDEVNAHLFLGYIYYFDLPSSRIQAMDCFNRALTLDPSSIIELMKALPPDIIGQLQNQNNALSEVKGSTVSSNLQPKETGKTTSTTTTAAPPKANPSVSTAPSSTVLSLIALSSPSAETKSSLSFQQIRHLHFQAHKKHLKHALEEQSFANEDDEKAENKIEDCWDIPNFRTLYINSPDVYKLTFKGRPKSSSYLRGILDTDALIQQKCPSDLLSEAKKLLVAGDMVGKIDDKGIRILNDTESKIVARRLGKKSKGGDSAKIQFVAKIKFLGLYGNSRIYAQQFEGRLDDRNKVLCFNTLVKKSHRK